MGLHGRSFPGLHGRFPALPWVLLSRAFMRTFGAVNA